MASQSQASSSKPRSMLPRTLVIVLSPISHVPSTKLGRFSSKRFEKVFEDFKQSNKQSISVQLQDAVDDIHFVGWISPFTLLIHGSAEDMDTIKHAWVGRMLKPPTDFIIKDFGVISEVNMKQVSQSQFISICDTLCDVVKGLNEGQIAATFESILSRLSSSFDSVVIPPMAAIKKSLDILVGEQRLDFIDGSYYFRTTATANASKPIENIKIASQTPKIETQLPNSLLSKRTGKKRNNNIARKDLKGYIEMEHVKEGIKTKKFENVVNFYSNQQQKRVLNKKEPTTEESTKRKSPKNSVGGSSSLKARKLNHCIPRRQYSYEKLNSSATPSPTKHGCKKQIKKRNSFLGKLSRLFKMESSAEDGKLVSDDETDNKFDVEICHKGWEKIATNENTKLLSCETKVKRKHKPGKRREKKNTIKESRLNVRTVSSKKQVRKTKQSRNLLSKVRQTDPSQMRRSLTNTSSHSRSPDLSHSPDRAYYSSAPQQKPSWKCSLTRDQGKCHADRYSQSSFSESSCYNINNSDDSCSSQSSVELARKSLYCSAEDSSDIDSSQACRGSSASNFCSTQAICGDLELSTLSLNPVSTPAKSQSSDSSSTNIKHSEQLTTGVMKNGPLDHDCQQNKLRCRNLVQLIGIL